jgi:hypothetical protein
MPLSLDKAGLRSAYPGLSDGEALVWSRWLLRHGPEVTGVAYAVPVGGGRPVPAGTPDWLARDWLALTRLRIDCVVDWQGALWVVEVKERQTLSALGQCLVYASLLTQEYDLPARPGMLHVCALDHPDMLATFRANGVLVEVA